jgi:hypothetical protein
MDLNPRADYALAMLRQMLRQMGPAERDSFVAELTNREPSPPVKKVLDDFRVTPDDIRKVALEVAGKVQ